MLCMKSVIEKREFKYNLSCVPRQSVELGKLGVASYILILL